MCRLIEFGNLGLKGLQNSQAFEPKNYVLLLHLCHETCVVAGIGTGCRHAVAAADVKLLGSKPQALEQCLARRAKRANS